MSSANTTYRGRFAPSPTGPLHWGSLTTALASWLEARRHDGVWLVRMDDLDPPRQAPGAAETLIRQLTDLGLEPDEPVYYQSRRGEAYQAAVEQLLEQGHAFYCKLSRKQLRERGGIHPGPAVAVAPDTDSAIRLAVPDNPVHFDDLFQGRQEADLQAEGGAFTLQRRDGPFGYQLACALDEAWLGITHVIRGADLMASTLRQQWVLHQLGLAAPAYGHLPVLVDAAGEKLAKSSGAEAVDTSKPAATLTRALELLAQQPPAELAQRRAHEVLDWGRTHWHPERLYGVTETRAG